MSAPARPPEGGARVVPGGTREAAGPPERWAAVRLALVCTLLAGAAWATARPAADDPALEARVQSLANQLRCLVCQNQTIADSHADLAIDLKNQVREQLRAGRSEAEVLDYMTQRYGDFVLYRPPWKASTALLWTSPLIALLAGGLLLHRSIRRAGRPEPPPPLDDDTGLAELQDEDTPGPPVQGDRSRVAG
ncbi:MAG: cytochrome c-type biogenesis protein CcmH [Ideonella sp.]|nr:cytochrome c-type biogenesis protein CcmH [Ideonella sp.]